MKNVVPDTPVGCFLRPGPGTGRDLTAFHPMVVTDCPHLPVASPPVTYRDVRALGPERGPRFYLLALQYAQELWRQGLPAQSLLLINRALGADLPESGEIQAIHPLPYAAAAWIMIHRAEEQFIGNPRRHYQHLASRMVEPRKELRTWRAWACWHLACLICPDCPADEKQIAEEGLVEPSVLEIGAKLDALGAEGERAIWEQAVEMAIPR